MKIVFYNDLEAEIGWENGESAEYGCRSKRPRNRENLI